MGKSKPKKIEYKETEVFEIFPKFQYTKQQKVRCILFHAYKNNISKIIRYAAHFDVPEKICLVYIVGQPTPGKIYKELENADCSDRVCILTSNFPDEKMKFYKEFEAIRKTIQICGRWDNTQQDVAPNYVEEYYRYKKSLKQAKTSSNYNLLSSFVEEKTRQLEAVHQYKRLVKASKNTYFKKFTMYRRNHLPKPFTHDKLDSLIKKIYPFGTEANNITDYSALSPVAITNVFKSFPNFDKKLGFEVSEKTAGVKAIRRFINKSIKDRGYWRADELSIMLRSPPFGFSFNAYSIACVLFGLKFYDNRVVFAFDGCNTFRLQEIKENLCARLFQQGGSRRRTTSPWICYIESHPHKNLKKIISDVFGVKIQMPASLMSQQIRTKLTEEGHRLPLITVDGDLYSLVSIETDWYDRDALNKLSDQVTGKNDFLKKRLLQYYEQDKKLHTKELYPDASAWLFDRDWSKTENYYGKT